MPVSPPTKGQLELLAKGLITVAHHNSTRVATATRRTYILTDLGLLTIHKEMFNG